MNTPNQSNPQTELNKILEVIGKIVKISADGDYIFRGEPQCHEKVTSNLCRKLENIGLLDLGIETIEKKELEYAKRYRYTQETDEFKILTEIQHFGGKTNLLDFTTDYRIALLFACDSFPLKDGRVILQDKNGAIKDWIIEPCDPDAKSRVRRQGSIFVRSPKGFIEPDLEIVIPKFLKQPMLKYLEKEFDISPETIYPDLHGFVSSQDIRWNIYEGISKGNDHLESGQVVENPERKLKDYQKAVKHFTNAIDNAIQLDEGLALSYNSRGCAYFAEYELDNSADNLENAIADFSKAIKLIPKYAEAYNRRGGAYLSKGNSENAIADFNKAIELNSEFAEAYHNRGIAYFTKRKFILAIRDYTEAIQLKLDDFVVYYDRGIAWLHQQEWGKAKADLIIARSMEFNIITAFQDFYKNVEKCEQLIGAKLPSDIASLLTQP